MIAALVVGTGTGMVYPVLLAFCLGQFSRPLARVSPRCLQAWERLRIRRGRARSRFHRGSNRRDGALSVTAVVLVAACALFSLGAQKTHS